MTALWSRGGAHNHGIASGVISTEVLFEVGVHVPAAKFETYP